MARKRLGELLLDQGTISQDQLDAALAYQRQSGNRIGTALIALKAITEDKLCETLSQTLGLQVIQLDTAEVDWNALHALRDRFCEANDLFPVSLNDAKGGRRVLTVGMADPLNLPAIEEIEFTTGYKVLPRLAPLTQVRAAIRKNYHRQSVPSADDGAIVQAGGALLKAAPPRELPRDPYAVVRPTTDTLELEESQVLEVNATPSPSPGRPKSERTQLTELIEARAARTDRSHSAIEDDLKYLVGINPAEENAERLERVERRIWAVLRLMASKGLITREEFLAEFGD